MTDWVWIVMGSQRVLAFRYVDRTAGPSAKGSIVGDPPTRDEIARAVERPERTVREPERFGARSLDAGEVQSLGLPSEPPWLASFRGVASTSAPTSAAPAPRWRTSPELRGRFHPSHPDDLQVLVSDGEPRRTQRAPELCWVRVLEQRGISTQIVARSEGERGGVGPRHRMIDRALYRARLLNQPHALTSVRAGDEILFVVSPGLAHPIHVTEAYVRDRLSWACTPCDRCGADQTLDPPSTMARTRFPEAPPDVIPLAFTAFCSCGGTMAFEAMQSVRGR